jgi:hypothetical protein
MWYAFWCAFQIVFYSFIIYINVAWVIHFNMTMVRGKIGSESDISDEGPITIARPSGVTVAPTGIGILSPLPACRSVFRDCRRYWEVSYHEDTVQSCQSKFRDVRGWQCMQTSSVEVITNTSLARALFAVGANYVATRKRPAAVVFVPRIRFVCMRQIQTLVLAGICKLLLRRFFVRFSGT